MASTKIIQEKQNIVEEITSKLENSESVILFSYQGLTVADIAELRRELRNNNSEVKIYKNTIHKVTLQKMGRCQRVRGRQLKSNCNFNSLGVQCVYN